MLKMKPEIITASIHAEEAQQLGLTGILAAEYVRAKGYERHESRVELVKWRFSADGALAALAALNELATGGFGGGSPMGPGSGCGTRQLSAFEGMGTNRAHAGDAAVWQAARECAAIGHSVTGWHVTPDGWLVATVRTPVCTEVLVEVCEFLQDEDMECVLRFAASQVKIAIQLKEGAEKVRHWCRIADWAKLSMDWDSRMGSALSEGFDESFDQGRAEIKALVASWGAEA